MEVNCKKERIEVFDIAIILVVVGHLDIFYSFFYLFHMPFFFFIAGYFSKKTETIKDVFEYIQKRFFRLLFVYFSLQFLFILLHNFLINIHIYQLSQSSVLYSKGIVNYYNNLQDIILALFCHVEPIIQPAWFLLALFFVSTIFALMLFLTSKLEKNSNWLLLVSVLCFSQLGYWFYLHDINTAYIGTICSVIFIYYLGYLASKINILNICSKFSLFFSFALLIIINSFTHSCLDLTINYYYNPAFLILVTILGVILIISVAEKIRTFNSRIAQIFSYIGTNTIPILMLHFL